jgi:hypothetical protein
MTTTPDEPAAALVGKPARDALVRRHRVARAAYNRAMDEHAAQFDIPIEIGIDASSSAFVDTDAYRRAREALAEMEATDAAYFRDLPRIPVSCCPHCDKPLYRAFDPFGLDGLWWRSDAQPDEPLACPHFCALLGAVDLRSSRPRPDFDLHPGPDAPFVIPRLLEKKGMVAIISEIQLADGAVAYPIAYFAPRRPPVQALAAPWARTNFVYSTQLGVHSWRQAGDPAPGESAPDAWDFDLQPWIASGRIRWCAPGGDRSALIPPSTTACPFADLPGSRQRQVILADPAGK